MDVRNKLSFAANLDNAWKLQSLHDIAVGLWQLHSTQITHQDLKPSNVLLYHDSTISKIGDLGRSLCESIHAPHDNGKFTGDFRYAPPELLYGYYIEDASIRKYATDCYLFGSMVVFYFIGLNMTSLLAKNINKDFKWSKWRGAYKDVTAYVLEAFNSSITEFKSQIENETLRDELGKMVEYLCFPIPEKRGHPRSIYLKGNQYSMERFISRFDYLSKKAKFKLL
ncbi:MAG: protein kinase family protein [Gammaproteobacteria bacterium]|nr:protein kinase family protein [Gammaproteobacteria bacterium]